MKVLGTLLLLIGVAGLAVAIPPPAPAAPEIDTGSAGSALALLSGATLDFQTTEGLALNPQPSADINHAFQMVSAVLP